MAAHDTIYVYQVLKLLILLTGLYIIMQVPGYSVRERLCVEATCCVSRQSAQRTSGNSHSAQCIVCAGSNTVETCVWSLPNDQRRHMWTVLHVLTKTYDPSV